MYDTIFAVASGKVPCAVAVVRISGSATSQVALRLLRQLPAPRFAHLSKVWHPTSGLMIDQGIALWFPGPKSYTGEDYLELQVHGGRAVLGAIVEALLTDGLARLANPGEFSLRAFLNGKIDLASLEGLGDLIHAESELQRQQSIRIASGYLSAAVEGWRRNLISCMALIEASIDFSEEADVPDEVFATLDIRLRDLALEFRKAITDSKRAEVIRSGFRVALIGAPNVGKSSLLNALAKRDVAIVADIPGTTRDTIEVHVLLGGLEVVFLDTAGIRPTDDQVELLGIKRTRMAADRADLILHLFDHQIESETERFVEMSTADVLYVQTKADLGQPRVERADYLISAESGHGLDDILERVELIANEATSGSELPLVTRERHKVAVQRALDEIEQLISGGLMHGSEIVSEHLRLALRMMESVVGRVDTEDVLGDIFSKFCIGK